MNATTFSKRTKAHRPTPTARTMVEQWMRTGQPIYPVQLKGRGKRTANDDRTAEVLGYLSALGVKVEATGNDAPRGGMTGNWIKPTRASWRKLQPVVNEWAEAAKALLDAEQAAKDARHQAAAQRYAALVGDHHAVLLEWWSSKAYHPAPRPVMDAKAATGMTWSEIRTYCKGQMLTDVK